jgi:uncharacterized protein (TIGR02302 family)
MSRKFSGLHIKALRIAALFLMTLERLLENLWNALLWVCAFASLWLFQIPQWFGKSAEIGFSILFIAGLFYYLMRGMNHIRLPRHSEVTRRIEEDSNIRHRPLSSLEDRLANPAQEDTRLLWSLWQETLRPALLALRWPRPRPLFSQIDPYALRALAVVVLAAGIIAAGGTWSLRLKHGLFPMTFSAGATPSDNVIIWITPPAYTGQPQIVLKGFGRKDQPVSIPEGSIVKARVNGWIGTPSLMFDDKAWPMRAMGKGSYGIEKAVERAGTLKIRQMMLPRSRWSIAYGADLPPVIEMTGDPQIQPKGEIIFPLKVKDDYGVESLTARIRLDQSSAPPLGSPVKETLPVMSPPQTAMDFKPQFDLAWHPWAGMDVVVDLEVTDHKGQSAHIKDLHIKLPERAFRHPVARRLVEMRKRLIWTPEAAAKNIAFEIESIMAQPGVYHNDPIVFLALRSAVSRLFYDATLPSVSTVVSLLWDTALHIEDGNFSMAQRNLRDIQKQLQDALRNPNATPDEIASLMEQMRGAMANYLNEMFREMQKRMAESGADMHMMSPEAIMQNINPDDLSAFLDKMQAEAMTGDRNKAREMLSQMSRLMEMLDPSAMQTEMPKDMQDMMETVSKLQDLIEKQKKLLSDTQSQAENAGKQQSYSASLPPNASLLKQWGIENLPPQPQDTRTGDKAPRYKADTAAGQSEQEGLRKTLGDLMLETDEKLHQIPESMGQAEEAMGQSSKALGQNNPGDSIPHQEAAIAHLSEGQRQMSQQLGERMKQMMMLSFGMGPSDPLGRPTEGNGNAPWSASKVKIPDKAERKRVQDILEELRKKSGELQRPDYELDYYRRLMRQF